MAICLPCSQGNCAQCGPVADPDREMTFTDCDHFCDPIITQRDAQVTALLVAAQVAFGRGDDEATKTALRRCLAALDGRPEKPAKPLRKFHLVGAKPGYAQASGEPVAAEWLSKKHDSVKR